MLSKLQSVGQSHLFPVDAKTDDVSRLVDQLTQLDEAFPGGLEGYITRARVLLDESKQGKNPFDDYEPVIPEGETLETGSDEYMKVEALGIENAHKMCFCLVAGGLGERLGYPDIKVGLPVETVTGMTYLEFYLRMIRSIASVAKAKVPGNGSCPLAIMTSGDTHSKTVALLEKNDYFGFPKESITIMQQKKVPALIDSEGRIAVSPDDPYSVLTKPHGHGDVHVLLHQHGLPAKWLKEGRSHMLIFQDTNALVCHAILPMLGVSVKKNLVMNSLAIARKPGDAVGAICKLQPKEGTSAKPLTINVEYNHLSALLASSPLKGDTADPKTGNSPFPGNANVLMLQLEGYKNVLDRSKGTVPEFVNPKYKDETRTAFKSPTRLECLMQDLPRLFEEDEKAGFTMLDRWFSFSTVKNNVADAAAKSKSGGNPEAPFTAEADQSNCNARMLKVVAEAVKCPDVFIAEPQKATYLGIDYDFGPTIVFDPLFTVSLSQLKDRMRNCQKLRINTVNSTLVIKGPNVNIKNLVLEGSKIVEETQGSADIEIDEEVKNKGYERCVIDETATDQPVHMKIRGYFYRHLDS